MGNFEGAIKYCFTSVILHPIDATVWLHCIDGLKVFVLSFEKQKVFYFSVHQFGINLKRTQFTCDCVITHFSTLRLVDLGKEENMGYAYCPNNHLSDTKILVK